MSLNIRTQSAVGGIGSAVKAWCDCEMRMIIPGIDAYHGDSLACLEKRGKPAKMAGEKWFRRIGTGSSFRRKPSATAWVWWVLRFRPYDV